MSYELFENKNLVGLQKIHSITKETNFPRKSYSSNIIPIYSIHQLSLDPFHIVLANYQPVKLHLIHRCFHFSSNIIYLLYTENMQKRTNQRNECFLLLLFVSHSELAKYHRMFVRTTRYVI